MNTPLIDYPIPLRPISHFERFCWFVPLLGWIIAAILDARRRRPKVEHFRMQIAARTESATAAWGEDPDRREVATGVCRAIQREFGWDNTHYLPQDKLELLMWGMGGGGGPEPLFCLIDVERRFGIKLVHDGTALFKLTLGEFVDLILGRMAKSRGMIVKSDLRDRKQNGYST